MNTYFDLDKINEQVIPKAYGYKAKLVEDKLNNIGFYKLVKTEQLIEIEELKQKLFDTDYQAIKYAEGLISEEEYESIKVKRQSWRDRINELEKELEEIQNGL